MTIKTKSNAKLFFEKTFTRTDDTRNTIKVKGIPRKVTFREIFAVQMKRSIRKWCKVFVIYIKNDNENDNKLKLEDVPILKESKDIFLEEVPGIPLKKNISFTIDLIPGVVPTSKYPYQMNIIEITLLKYQLQE